MKSQTKKAPQFNGWDSVTINLNTFAKIEQAELIARFYINSSSNQHEAAITMCCIADLLYDVLNQTE